MKGKITEKKFVETAVKLIRKISDIIVLFIDSKEKGYSPRCASVSIIAALMDLQVQAYFKAFCRSNSPIGGKTLDKIKDKESLIKELSDNFKSELKESYEHIQFFINEIEQDPEKISKLKKIIEERLKGKVINAKEKK